MADKETTNSQEPQCPKLLVPRSEAEEKIKKQIDKGREIVRLIPPFPQPFFADTDQEEIKARCNKWSAYNRQLLKVLFSDDSIADGFTTLDTLLATIASKPDDIHKRIEKDITDLESIIERLELIPESTQIHSFEQSISTKKKGNDKKSSQRLEHKTAKIALITATIALISAILTSPIWSPLKNKIFRHSDDIMNVSCEPKKIGDSSPETIPTGPNRPGLLDYNDLGLKHSEYEKSFEPEEKEAHVNRPKPSPIFKVPDATITPEETTGEVNEPKKPEFIKRKERPIEPEEQ